ncbi:outer membrane protein [Vibrio inusitatus NBRC 102082]|uniref:Outer membrane protein n=1 Tax=Vibrio inusitatus NBRC 102082 TaxID=1219070 RepID=A0A4Y3HVM0_9VIBR|nr:efflux transporter outer membrane subunit [Vibrio inusitatus]GEA50780.1 outer membrane protein [Vibrio inusitatus NBRC 102082]
MKSRKLTPILLSMLLAGCAVGPEYEAPQDTVGSAFLVEDVEGTAASDEKVKAGWWAQFEDETLDELVNIAQNENISLQIAAQRVKSAQAYQRAVESFKVPTITVNMGATSYGFSENDPLVGPLVTPGGLGQINQAIGQDSVLDSSYDFTTLSANISWEVDVFNRLEYQAQSAQARAEQVEIMREGMVTLITSDVIHNYFQFRGAQERKQIAIETQESQRETLKLVESLVRNGYGSDLDLAQAKAALSATKAILPQLDIAKNVHKQRLAILLGKNSAEMDELLAKQGMVPDFKGTVPIGLASDVLQSRPDIRIAEKEMVAINADVGAAVANKYPRFYLTGSPGLLAGDFSDLFSSDSAAWVASVGASWTVFDGGRTDAQIDLQESRFNAAALGYEQTVNTAISEVETLLYTYGSSQEAESYVADTLVEADNAVAKADSLYRAGLVDYISVLDAQRQQKLVRDAQVSANLQTSQVLVSLHKALGGNWEIDPEPESEQGQEATQTQTQ